MKLCNRENCRVTASLSLCVKTLFAAMCVGTALAETQEETAARIKWFTDARFGMFVHFGA